MKMGEILQAFVISVLLLNKAVNVNEKRFFPESKNGKKPKQCILMGHYHVYRRFD